MTTLREAAQQALDALGCIESPLYVHEINKVGAAMASLRAALEQPEPAPEPVAWQWLDTIYFGKQIPADVEPDEWRPLYAVPPITQTAIEKWKRMANVMGEYHKPLSDQALWAIWDADLNEVCPAFRSFVHAARAVEAAHGIKDET